MSDRRIVGSFLAAVMLVGLVVTTAWMIRVGTAEWRGRGDAHITIQSGANRIVQYQYFFALCEAVQSAEGSIDAQRHLLESDYSPKAMVAENLAALEAERQRSINTYNARAAADYTSGQFLASDLPYQLSTAPYETEKTRCAA